MKIGLNLKVHKFVFFSGLKNRFKEMINILESSELKNVAAHPVSY